ncbi:hypothetical protein DFH08DRAFT_985646 [Mycena albidolilacea]|uniref:Uncharacterized protein n=1 Tax=Mycena albidolilacea TaxID=1033008 RepID=A0AAD6Z2J1_9AGAR|nr:hypothetical protein DFH08DRAFT_985646 [Mycena albidolilacea]
MAPWGQDVMIMMLMFQSLSLRTERRMVDIDGLGFIFLARHAHQLPFPPRCTQLRIIKSLDQQASIFLPQKLKVAGPEERARIVDAICARVSTLGFGNGAAAEPDERRKIVPRYASTPSFPLPCANTQDFTAQRPHRVVDLATNCYGCYVHQNQQALDCKEEVYFLLVLQGDPATTPGKNQGTTHRNRTKGTYRSGIALLE